MPYELVDNGATVQLFGNAFLPGLDVTVPVVVDGDLVVEGRIIAPEITVMHGSLICPSITCKKVHADILGIFDTARVFVPPVDWTYTWLRPCWTVPVEADIANDSIERVVQMFLRPEMVTDTTPIAMLMERVRARPACLRARVLFAVALEELLEHPAVLTPLGRQVAECLMRQHRLPDCWRF